MARPTGNPAELVRRDTPEGFVKYMCANPVHFRMTFGKPLSESNLMAELRRRFPGRVFEAPEREQGGGIMAKKGTCANCRRDGMTIVKEGLCGTCGKAVGSLTGKAREKALADVKDRIDRGQVKARGRNAKGSRVVTDIHADNAGVFSEETQKGVADSVQKVIRGSVAGKDRVEAQLRGLLRLIDETAKMGLATDITVSIKIGGIDHSQRRAWR